MEDGTTRAYINVPGKRTAAVSLAGEDMVIRGITLAGGFARASNIMEEIPAGSLAVVDDHGYEIKRLGTPFDAHEYVPIHDDDRIGRADEHRSTMRGER